MPIISAASGMTATAPINAFPSRCSGSMILSIGPAPLSADVVTKARARIQSKGNLAHTFCGSFKPTSQERINRWVLGFPDDGRGNRGAALAAAGKAHVVSGRGRNGDRGAENFRRHALCLFPPRAHLRGLRNHLRGCISDDRAMRFQQLTTFTQQTLTSDIVIFFTPHADE